MRKAKKEALTALRPVVYLFVLAIFFLGFSFALLEAQEASLQFGRKVFLPHRNFNASLCEDCHRYLANYEGEIAGFCLFCHDGTFGQPVSDTFKGEYLHYGRNCLACHSPHLIAEKSPGLLKAKGKTGEDFCFACHFNQTTQTVAFFKSRFNQGVHALPSKSKSRLSCLNCHLPHSSNSPKMEGFQGEDGFEEEKLCFNCHQKQEDEFSSASHHSVANKEVGLECVSCHNPHFTRRNSLSNPDNTFVSLENRTGFCLTCHDGNPPRRVSTSSSLVPYSIYFPSVQAPFFGGWDKSAFPDSAHALSKVTCSSCHLPHGSDNLSLLGFEGKDRNYDEEKLCLACHSAGKSSSSVGDDFKKPSRHPVEKANLHRADEDMTGLAYDPENSKRHAECYDCHDPHQATAENPLNGIGGVDLRGRIKKPVENVYELCFKCHTGYTFLPPEAEDLRQSFNPLNPSYHPVIKGGKNSISPSAFNAPYNSKSKICCLDCHGSDSGNKSVHGSNYSPILQKPAEKEKPDDEESLCFKCHKYSVYTSSSPFTRFPNHFQHAKRFACLICHQAHGSVEPALIRKRFVLKDKTYKLEFSLNEKSGSCQVSPAGPCHDQKTYERAY